MSCICSLLDGKQRPKAAWHGSGLWLNKFDQNTVL